ncbi:MAG: ATP-binding protein, partial [Planctomycetota bacterium]
ERFLLLSVDAVDKLRRELYEILGPIMAHELLFRFGFSDGVRSARIVRAQIPGLSPREALEAGPVVLTLEGMARVTVEEIRWEDELERMTGSWEDSFEAEESLRQWGTVDWTACWVLTGFASGYATEIADRELLCVERACRARGDAVCRFEILPADEFPGLARKVSALRRGLLMRERMKPTITRLWEKAYTTSAYLARILQDSADAIVTVDENEVVQTWNRGAEELLGYPAEDVVGRHFRFLVPQDLLDQGEIEKVRQEMFRSGSLRNYETRRLRSDGEEVHVSLTRTPIHDAHGRYIGASAILRDVTERKRLVEQLIQAESLAEVGELAAQVAHEIKNPLAGISAALQVLTGTLPEEIARGPVLEEVREHIRRLDDTVLSLLRFTRPYRPDFTRTDLDLVLDSAISLLGSSEDFRDVEVARELDPAARHVQADSQQLIQVFTNLLLNSGQACGKDRTIIVRASPADDQVRVEVRDRGSGIPADIMKLIFKPFFTTKHKGTGLGLPIARKIVEAHGGTIRVSSRRGGGIRVEILFPVR